MTPVAARLPPRRREFDRAGRLARGDPGGQVGHQGAERKAWSDRVGVGVGGAGKFAKA